MIGTVVSHYRVTDKLGAGGMGVVYRAEDQRLRRQVALKFLPDSAAADPLAVERFEREARTASALNHPHICTIHDVGEAQGRRFIVMELIEGLTLDRLIAAGPLSAERLIEIGIQVSDALDAAHAEGILHRDIKPGNIFLTKRDQVKVVDFGLAKMMPHRAGTQSSITDGGHFHTSVGIAVGTVAYMSPEHARGEGLDARSDIFSLGVVLYEMATGVQTFRGQTTAVIFDQILNRVPPAPSVVNPQIPLQLEQIVARALEKDRRVRYQTARDLQAALERLRRELTSRRTLHVTAESAVSVGESWARDPRRTSETALLSGPAFEAAVPRPDSARISDTSDTLVARPALAGNENPTLVDEDVTLIVRPPAVPSSGPATPTARVGTAPSPQPALPGSTPARRSVWAARATTPAPYRGAGQSAAPWIVGGGIAAAMLVAGGAWWVTQRPEVAVRASDTAVPPTPLPAPETTPSAVVPPPGEPVATAPATPTTAATGAAPAVSDQRARKPGAAARTIEPTATAGHRATPASAREVTPAPTPVPSAEARLAEAENALGQAKGLVGRDDAQALASLQRVVTSYGGTPSAREALALSAEIYQRRNEWEAATDNWVAYGGQTGDGERAGEGLIRTADAAARRKSATDDEIARRALHELLSRFPSGSRAIRALQMKMSLEDRRKLKQADPEFKESVPTSLLTLRTVATASGSWPVSEFALWRLGEVYKDRRLHSRAADTYASLASRFPNTTHDAWFAAAEIYDRQLKDPARAREAYLRVPSSSRRFDDAQRRARRD